MKFIETKLKGAYLIEIDRNEDERGYFARSWDKNEFQKMGLNNNLIQCNISFNKKKGTLRGLHYQEPPFVESKLIRCTKGSIFDVIVDLRPNSTTKNNWFGVELTEKNYTMLYVPEGFAHGFQTLEDNSEIFYQMTKEYVPEYAKGKLWNDPIFNIQWPIFPPILSNRDKQWKKHTA